MADFGKLRRYLKLPSRSAARIKREVEQELQLHIDMRAEALEQSGMSASEARAEAIRHFGDVDDATRYCTAVDRHAERQRRTSGWLDEVRQDTVHALRVMRRAPAFAAATVLTLALAVGATTAVSGVLYSYLVRPLPFPESDRLMSINDAPSLARFPNTPSLRDVDWTRVDSLFEATAAWDLDGFTIPGHQGAESVTGAWVSPGYFQSLKLRPALGRGFRPDEYRDALVVLISHDLWVRRFGADSSVIGSTITAYSNDRPTAPSIVTIVGVLPRDFWPIHWRVSDLLRPLPPDPRSMPALAKLKPGMTQLEATRRLDAIVRAQVNGVIDPEWHMSLVPALDRHSARVRPLLAAVCGAALFMLFAACASVAGALVSRMAARRSELAVRLALGGSRARIVRQLLTESAVLATLAGALGLVIAYVFLEVSGAFVEQQLGTKVPGGATALRPTAMFMGLSVLASTLAGVVLGLVPALTFLRLDRKSVASAVLGAGRSSSARSGAHVRRVLIASQVTVAMVLLFGAGLMFRTIARMGAIELGFRVDGVITGSMLLPDISYPDSAAKRQVIERVLAGVTKADGVRSAAAVYPAPFQGAWRFPVIGEGSGLDERSAPQSMVFTVSSEYFETMEVRLRDGRTFRATDDHAAPLVVVISEALARRLSPSGSVIGRRIRVRVPYLASFDDVDGRPWRTVIGVVTDTEKDFEPNASPDVYVPYAQNPRARLSLVVRTDRPERTMFEPVRRAVASVDPALALSGIETMRDVIVSQGGQRRGLTVLLGVFATFALGLSALALYASLSYAVVQRRSELAVRMAVGASASSILRLIVGDGLATVAVGVVGGVVASLALGRVLEDQVYGVGTSDPATLVSISLVLTLAAVAASIVPGLRATRTDPALALRE
jgi:predicted permease